MNRRKLLTLCFSFILLAPFQLSAAIVFNGHEYALTSTASNWTSAQAEAESLGGYLVAIDSLEEQTFIEETFLVGSYERLPLWIGLTDVEAEGDFSTWNNGELVTFTKWKSNEPNNLGGGEDFVAINWDYSRFQGIKGSWNDAPLNGTVGYGGNTNGPYYGLIEYDSVSTVVPEPTSMLLFGLGAMGLGVGCRRRKGESPDQT